MTNLQKTAPTTGLQAWLTRERVLVGGPLVLGALASLGLLGLVVMPAFQALSQAQEELTQLQEQARQLPLLKRQLVSTEERINKASLQQAKILGLIAGSGDISTFLAQLGEEASRSGILLTSYEPVQEAAPNPDTKPAAAKPAEGQAPPPPPDPLQAPGLQKTSLLISAQGPAPRVLDFLRRMERLSLLVVQSNLNIKLDESKDKANAARGTTLKLNLALYSKAPATAVAADTKTKAAKTP